MPAASEFREFRPRQVRVISMIGAIIVVIGFAVLSVALLVVDWAPWTPYDIIWMNVLGVLFGLALLRISSIRATPDEEGITVRNMVRTKRLAWNEILGVSFGPDGDDPWPLLDLADGSTWPVMAIQHADGPRAHAEALRLAKLVGRWTDNEEDTR